ncbi:MAG TPA: type II secretion system minor pseudopilin GspH [Steroidobacteraceae bacterium]|nr:type II secretion system minor pseudopilin GspH [Steroidobacteraceae bacterium]
MPVRSARGFTLVELLVVIVIIGVLTSGAIIAFGTGKSDTQLENERDRLSAIIDYVRERGELQTVEYGLYCTKTGYQVVRYNPRQSLWMKDPNDDLLKPRTLPAGLGLQIVIEGRAIVLDAKAKPELTPQVLLYSNGDTNSFSLTMLRAATGQQFTIQSGDDGMLTVGKLMQRPT